MLPKVSGYVKRLMKLNACVFGRKNNELLKKYHKICNCANNVIKKQSDIQPV